MIWIDQKGKQVLNLKAERYSGVIDHDLFTYTHYSHTEPTWFIHKLHTKGYKNRAMVFLSEVFQ